MSEPDASTRGSSSGAPGRLFGGMIALAVASLIFSIVLGFFGRDFFGVYSAGHDSFSRSAVGHHALLEFLGKLGMPVEVSEHMSESKSERDQVLLLLEPSLPAQGGTRDDVQDGVLAARVEEFQALLDSAPAVLVVLPKWRSIPNPLRRDWVETCVPAPDDATDALLDALDVEATVRPPRPSGEAAAERTDWTCMGLRAFPTLERPQLVRSRDIVPLVYSSEGILVGRLRTEGLEHVILLSDPDLIANHGLGEGDNAAFFIGLLEHYLRAAGRPIVIDETLHGYLHEPSLFRDLFRFPVALVTVQVLVLALLLLWSGSVRFGAPVALPVQPDAGKRFLISNTASLLAYGRHTGYSLERYFQMIVRDAAEALRVPSSVPVAQWPRWLAEHGRRRGVEVDVPALAERVRLVGSRRGAGERERIAVARAIGEWKKELLDGTRRDPRRR